MSGTDPYDGVEFGLQLDAGTGLASVAGVIVGGEFRMLAEGDPEATEPTVGPTRALPLYLADLAFLGPRIEPTDDAPILFVEELEGMGRPALAAAWADDVKAGTPLDGDEWLYWTAFVAWQVGDETVEDGIVVIDGGDHGIAMVHQTEDGVYIRPCTTTDVWMALCGLLPRTIELTGAAS